MTRDILLKDAHGTAQSCRRAPRWRTMVLSLASACAVLLGCSGDTNNPVSVPADHAYWVLQLNQHAINLAVSPPYNTVRLSAVALTASGLPITEAGAVQYQGQDSSVLVDSTGLVTAHYVTAEAHIIAALTVQGVTLTDTAIIQVTPAALPHPLTMFSIQPRADGLDSARFAVDGSNFYNAPILPVYATDANGETVCDVTGCALAVAFSSSDPTIASIDRSGRITPNAVGHVTFTATTWAYGVVKHDLLPFVVTYPTHGFVNVNALTPAGGQAPVLWISPAIDTVGVGADVNFSNYASTDTVDIAFADSTAVSGGNIPILALLSGGHCCADRIFAHEGTYAYHSRKLGTSGAIVVSRGP